MPFVEFIMSLKTDCAFSVDSNVQVLKLNFRTPIRISIPTRNLLVASCLGNSVNLHWCRVDGGDRGTLCV